MNETTRRVCALVGCVLLFAAVSGCSRQKGGPPKENLLRFAIEAKVPSLDPHMTTDVYSHEVYSLAYDGLYEFHYLKKDQILPVLADGMPEVSKDKKTWTFHIKKGVHFHDDPCFEASGGKGRELVAQDFVDMFERIAGPKQMSPAFSSFEGKIVGIDEFHQGKTSKISGVRVKDPYAFEIALTAPMPRFIYNFVAQGNVPIPKECVTKYGDQIGTHPVGTGPYRFVEVGLGSKFVAVRNPNYTHVKYPSDGRPGAVEAGLLADAGKDLPFIDKVVIEVIPEQQPMWLKFLAAEIDLSKIPKDNLPSVLPNNKLNAELSAKGVRHYQETRGDVTVQIFNMDDPVWGKKKELRQAFALALDVPKVIEIQYSGQAIRAHSLVDPTQYGYDPAFRSKWTDRNLVKAKELLAKAGYPDGKGLPPLVMPTSSSTTARHLDELLTRQLAEVGITLKPEPMTWPEMMERKKNRNFVSLGLGFASSVPDADDALPLLHSKNKSPGPNGADYVNPAVDKLVDEIETMENGPARLAKIRKVLEIVDEDLPYVAMAHRMGNQLVQPWVRNHVYVDENLLGYTVKYHRVDFGTK